MENQFEGVTFSDVQAAPGVERIFNVAFTNRRKQVERLLDCLEHMLSEKPLGTKIVDFDLEYMMPIEGVQYVALAQLSSKTRCCGTTSAVLMSLAPGLQSSWTTLAFYTFATVDDGNNCKVLRATGLFYPSLVDIQAKYKIPDNNKSRYGLVDLTEEIIDRVSYGSVNLEPAFPGEFYAHWTNPKLIERQVKYATIDAHVIYELYRRIHHMRQCLMDDLSFGNGLRGVGGMGKKSKTYYRCIY